MEVKSFRNFLVEAEVKKMAHLEHIEDYIFSGGNHGINTAIVFLENIIESLQGQQGPENIVIQGKWDGSPSLIFGKNPENDKFFVATKAAFSKDPKLCYNDKLIDAYYSKEPGLVSKLKTALKYLPGIVKSGIYQGDLLFTEDIKNVETIEGIKYITFQPNTIKYGVQEGSERYKTVDDAAMGIIIHAQYDGDTIKDLNINVDIDKGNLKKSVNVWYEISTHEDIAGKNVKFSPEETNVGTEIINNIKKMAKRVDSAFLEQISRGTKSTLIQQFNNQVIRTDKPFDTDEIVDELNTFIDGKEKTEKISMATRDNLINFFHSYRTELLKVYAIFNQIKQAKKMLITKLEELSPLATFNDNKKIKGEGFVIIDKTTGHITKLVDRREFSKLNFQRRMKESLFEGLDLSKYNTTPAKNKVNIFMGKLQPPHRIHMKRIKDGYISVVFLTKGIFPFEVQKKLIQTVLGKEVDVQQVPGGIFLPAIISSLRNEGKEVNVAFCGEDRLIDYQKQAKYFPEINSEATVEALGTRSDDSDGEEVSGTNVRNALKNNDFNTYRSMMSPEVATKEWFDLLKQYV